MHDVSPVMGADLPVFCLAPGLGIQPLSDHQKDGVASNLLEFPEHSGAHVDAPFHFDPHGQTIEKLAADVLFLRTFKKFDLSVYEPQPGEPVDVDQLIAAADRGNFALEDGDVAVLDFGWDRYLPDGEDARDPSWWGANEPGLTKDACEYLATAGVAAVASDTVACDITLVDGEIRGAPGHTECFLPRGILIVEGLLGLAAVPASGLFVALPLRIAGGTGSPLRVVLLTDQG